MITESRSSCRQADRQVTVVEIRGEARLAAMRSRSQEPRLVGVAVVGRQLSLDTIFSHGNNDCNGKLLSPPPPSLTHSRVLYVRRTSVVFFPATTLRFRAASSASQPINICRRD